MNNWPKVFVIILNWNGRQLLADCIKSLQAITYPNYSMLVVDNGSTDGSVEMVRQKYPQVEIIQNETNLGFSKANNIGIKQALASGAEYVLLLNNDVEVAPDFIDKLVQVAILDKKNGIVGPKIYFYDRPNVIWFAGGVIDFRYWGGGHIGYKEEDHGQYNAIKEVDMITGCSMLIKKEVIDKIGLLDENYFLYSEDTEYCYRAKLAGFNNIYVPSAIIWHKASSTNIVDSPLMDYYLFRNSLYFSYTYLKGKKRPVFLFYFSMRVVKQLIKKMLFLKFSNIKAIILGCLDYYRGVRGKSPYY